MSEYDNRGQVALWRPNSDNPKAPQARGSFIAHRDIKEGEEVDIALWRNHSDNPKAPVMKGKISDKQEGGSVPQPAPAPEDFDDDIPF